MTGSCKKYDAIFPVSGTFVFLLFIRAIQFVKFYTLSQGRRGFHHAVDAGTSGIHSKSLLTSILVVS